MKGSLDRRYTWACLLGLAVFAPSALIFAAGFVDVRTGHHLFGLFSDHPSNLAQGLMVGFGFWILVVLASLGTPLLLSAILLREARFVAVTFFSSIFVVVLAFLGWAGFQGPR